MARGPRRRASLQPRRPEFWVRVQRPDLRGLQVPGVLAAGLRGGILESAVPGLESVEAPALPGTAVAAGRARLERCSGCGVPAQRYGHAPPRAPVRD